jgi:hypothetical protein
MKNILKISLLLLFVLLPFTSLFAQEENLISPQESKYFELSLAKITQSPFNRAIEYELTVKPLIDSPRTQISWEVPLSFKVNTKHEEFVDLEINQTYTFKAYIKPTRSGTYDITASVISWQHDTNYTNSVSDPIVINNSLLVQPVFSDYIVGVVIIIVISLFILGAIIWLIIRFMKKGTIKVKRWLTPPI